MIPESGCEVGVTSIFFSRAEWEWALVMPEVLPGHLPGDLEGIWMGFFPGLWMGFCPGIWMAVIWMRFCPGIWMRFCPGTWMGLCLGTDLDMGFYGASSMPVLFYVKPGSQTEQRQNLQTGTKI